MTKEAEEKKKKESQSERARKERDLIPNISSKSRRVSKSFLFSIIRVCRQVLLFCLDIFHYPNPFTSQPKSSSKILRNDVFELINKRNTLLGPSLRSQTIPESIPKQNFLPYRSTQVPLNIVLLDFNHTEVGRLFSSVGFGCTKELASLHIQKYRGLGSKLFRRKTLKFTNFHINNNTYYQQY